jgi:hypothetical protein
MELIGSLPVLRLRFVFVAARDRDDRINNHIGRVPL